MKRYGFVDQKPEGYPLHVWIWGHRLRIGQHCIEYLLEFLNVLAGFKYRLGEGIKEGIDVPSTELKYTLFTRLGLRRFVFYDEKEKTRHSLDDRALNQLQQALREQVILTNGSDQDALKQLRTLFRAYSAIEDQRSWYAKSLFPVHENFLLWEALRKGATQLKYTVHQEIDSETFEEFDDEIAFDARNYFARGGEIYYLLLSAGTQHTPRERNLIASRLEELLKESNPALGDLARIIDETWQKLGKKDEKSDGDSNKTGHLGWILDPDCPIYTTFARDVATLLQSNLDCLETLNLLYHLIGFHLVLYIYHRAHPDVTSETHSDGSCNELCHLVMLIDVLEGERLIRDVSAVLLREQEARIIKKGQEYVQQQVCNWMRDTRNDIADVHEQAKRHFNLRGSSKRLTSLDLKVNNLEVQFQNGQRDSGVLIQEYSAILAEILMDDFRKYFLGVHTKLAKRVGFIAPKKGTNARFVLGDDLLKALVLANTPINGQMTFDEFLDRLYQNYGIVIGPEEAIQSNLFNSHRINIEYYDRNRVALLEKMKYAGLVVEYSDATAMIANSIRGF
jgi:hypothetical protein